MIDRPSNRRESHFGTDLVDCRPHYRHRHSQLPMSIRPESHLPFDRVEWHALARERLRWGVTTRVNKDCGHQYCDLTQPRCCSCIDTRPHLTRYYKYVDGRGMVAEAKRWSDYCPGCKLQHGEPLPPIAEPMQDVQMQMQDIQLERQLPTTRCVNCGMLGHALWDCPTILDDNESDPPGASRPVIRPSPISPASPLQSRDPPSSPPTAPPSSPFAVRLGEGFRFLSQLPSPSVALSPPRNISSQTSAAQSTSVQPPPATTMQPTSTQSASAALSSTRTAASQPQTSSHSTSRTSIHQERRARIRANFERSFGSIADIANDDNYISPIASMYSSAFARYSERERERELRNQHSDFFTGFHNNTPMNSSASSPPASSSPTYSPTSYQGFRSEAGRTSPNQTRTEPYTGNDNTRQLLESLRRRMEEDNRHLLESNPSGHPLEYMQFQFGRRFHEAYNEPPATPSHSARRREPPARPPTPEALPKEHLNITDECKVCFSQHCDTLLLPCAHLALCEVSFPFLRDLRCSGVLRRHIPK